MSQPTPKTQEKPKNHKKSKQKHKNTSSTNNNKRLQVTDSSGWTHVTTTSRARRIPPSTTKTTTTNTTNATNKDTATDTATDTKETLQPAEPPQDLTLEALEAQFRKHYERWQDSESWDVVRGAIQPLSPLAPTPTPKDTDKNTHTNPEEPGTTRPENGQIQSIISIGLGSPSGFLRGGWVDRRQVSMDQLAALVSIREVLGNVKTYAQDPVFNTLDAALLHSLGITVVEHPCAFERASKDSFLFCPGVERVHLDVLLRGEKPRALFGGPLEEMEESEAVQGFMDGKAVTKVPLFETDEKAFWGMRVYL